MKIQIHLKMKKKMNPNSMDNTVSTNISNTMSSNLSNSFSLLNISNKEKK